MKLSECACLECGGSPVENLEIGLCATCSHARRKADRQSKKFQVVTPVKKISSKQAKDLQDYGVLRRIKLQECPECEINIPGVCDGQATEVHHCDKRGSSLLKPGTFKSACRPCHVYIETVMSAEERRERGLLTTTSSKHYTV